MHALDAGQYIAKEVLSTDLGWKKYYIQYKCK